jgi:hypothetical protein
MFLFFKEQQQEPTETSKYFKNKNEPIDICFLDVMDSIRTDVISV